MKTIHFSRAQVGLILLSLLFVLPGFAQKTITWKGGTPGMENNWHCPRNWSTGKVPNEYSNVVIPDVSTGSQTPPVIRKGRVEVNALLIEPNAMLTIGQKAELIVVEMADGIQEGNIRLEGKLQLPGILAGKKANDSAGFVSPKIKTGVQK